MWLRPDSANGVKVELSGLKFIVELQLQIPVERKITIQCMNSSCRTVRPSTVKGFSIMKSFITVIAAFMLASCTTANYNPQADENLTVGKRIYGL